MEKLEMSSPQPTGYSKKSETSTGGPEYATERARLLLGCYRRGEANDPDTYVAAIAAVLATYPDETICYVTHPITGIPSKVGFLPTVKEIRDACEDHYGPTRRAIEREAQTRRQLEERARALPDMRPRPTYEELVRRCREDGLMIGGKGPAEKFDVEAFKAQHGISDEEWAAIPNGNGEAA
jgi:hypothetical protein